LLKEINTENKTTKNDFFDNVENTKNSNCEKFNKVLVKTCVFLILFIK
jgi:hypothetical protein